MALLTSLSQPEAERLLALYGLTLVALEPLAAGSVNSNFFVSARDGRGHKRALFGRIYEEQTESGATFEVQLNQRLVAAGIPVARPLSTVDGRPTVLSGEKPFALYERVDGEVLCLPRVSTQAAASVGRALGRVHLADLGGLSLSPSRFGFPEIHGRLDLVEAAGRASLSAATARLRSLARELESSRRTDLPTGLIHGDLFRDNVLMRDDAVSALLDFESASSGVFVYDLMVTLLAWCFRDGLDAETASALVMGYHSERPLEASEVDAMVTEGSIACVRFATTRLTDFSLRVPEGQAPARDYQRFFARLDALRSGALDEIQRQLTTRRA